MNDYRIINTRNASYVNCIYFTIEYQGKEYGVRTYYADRLLKGTVFIDNPDISISHSWFFRRPYHWFSGNTVEKRILIALKEADKKVKKTKVDIDLRDSLLNLGDKNV